MIVKNAIGSLILIEPMLIFFNSNYQLGSFTSVALLLLVLLKSQPICGHMIGASVLLACVSAWALLVLLIIQSDIDADSIRTILRPVRACLTLLGLWAFVVMFLYKRSMSRPDELVLAAVKVALGCIILNAAIIFLQFNSPAILDFSYRNLSAGEILEINKAQRMPGLFSSGGATVSAFQGFGILLSAYIYRAEHSRNTKRIFLFVALIIYSIILTGRSGLLFLPLAYFYLAMTNNDSAKISDVNSAVIRRMGKVIGLTLVLGATLILLLSLASRAGSLDLNPTLTAVIERTFETPLHYFETGEFRDRTISLLLTEQVVFPQNFSGLLFGDPSLLQNKGNYNSDIGYIRLIFGYGSVGLFFHIIFYAFLYANVRRSMLSRHSLIFFNTAFFSLFLLNGKELFFLARGAHNVLCLIVVAAIVGGLTHKRHNGRWDEAGVK